jgi:sporulation protein YlmC with PRC-barrel domain
MRLDLGRPVHCSDADLGKLEDIVVDPTTRRVTHLVVETHHTHARARLVPIELAQADDAGQTEIRLSCTAAEVDELPYAEATDYLRLGEFPVEDPGWDVGITEMLALPYYRAVDDPGVGMLDPEQGMTVLYDRVPKGEVEIRRASVVTSSDEHVLGHVEGFIVGDDQRIGHIVLEHGHLWGKHDVAIPIGAVARVDNDTVALSLSKADVEALEPMKVDRRHLLRG